MDATSPEKHKRDVLDERLMKEYHKDSDFSNTPSWEAALPDDDRAGFSISPRVSELQYSVEIQSGRFCFRRTGAVPGKNKGGGTRGAIVECSGASRLRLMQRFASLDYEKLVEMGVSFFWCTLTTPREYWEDVEGVYRALRRFHDRLEYSQRGKGYLGAFVRRELGGLNGALHYHLCIVGGEGITRAWLQEAWTACLRYEGPKPVRVSVEEVTDAYRISKYMSKYCSKAGYEGKPRKAELEVCELASQIRASLTAAGVDFGEIESASLSEAHNVGNAYTGGRWWYVWGDKSLPWGEITTLDGLDAKQLAQRIKRMFRRWRVKLAMERNDRKQGVPGFSFRHHSPKQFMNEDRFSRWLRTMGGGGFTVLLSPDLMFQFIRAAAYGVQCQRAGLVL